MWKYWIKVLLKKEAVNYYLDNSFSPSDIADFIKALPVIAGYRYTTFSLRDTDREDGFYYRANNADELSSIVRGPLQEQIENAENFTFQLVNLSNREDEIFVMYEFAVNKLYITKSAGSQFNEDSFAKYFDMVVGNNIRRR